VVVAYEPAKSKKYRLRESGRAIRWGLSYLMLGNVCALGSVRGGEG